VKYKSKWVVVSRDAGGNVLRREEYASREWARVGAQFWSDADGVAIVRVSRRSVEAWTDVLGHQHKHTYNDLLERWVGGVKVWDYQWKYNATHKRVKGQWVEK